MRLLSLLLLAIVTNAASAQNVAKVGTTEYATIEEAIAAWGPGKTLTLLSNVTTTSTVTVEVNATKSTQNWTLDLGDYTWTASGCNAFQLYAAGGTVMNQNYGLKVYANQNGGITASGKYCIECKYDNSTAGYRPRLEIHGGTYNGSYVIYYASLMWNSSSVSNGPSTHFIKSNDGSEPVFNGNFAMAKCPITINAGYFNGTSFNTYPVSSTANTNLYGGHFKSINAFPSNSNSKNNVYGTYRIILNVDGSLDIVNNAPATYEASTTSSSTVLGNAKATGYPGPLYFESANYAIEKYNIPITLNENVVATQNKSISSGTLTIDATAEGSDYTGNITLTGNNAKFVIKFPEGKGHYGVTTSAGTLHVEETIADGVVTRTYSRLSTVSNPEIKIGDTGYSTVFDAFFAVDGTTDNKTMVLQKDVTNAGIVTNGTAVNAAGKTVATFDLNGHSIGIGSVAAGNNADYTLTIIDSSEGKTGTVTNSDASLLILAITGITDYSGNYDLKIQAGTWSFDPSNVTVNGVTRNLVDEGYVSKDNGNGTWTVGEAVNYVAQIGTTKYETLAAAAAAAQTGETITLLADISDTGNISLKAGVTLDGDGKTISGNSAIYINKDGGTVKNVNFDNIHNSNSKLSAIYGSSLAGTATITGCTFDNCDWDAIQITPVAGANVVITDNAFSDDNEDGVTQQRYIHVQSAQNVDFSATINENVMTGKLAQEPIGVYYPTDKTKVDLTKNYIESINDICILIADNNGYAGELVFPAYTTAEKTETYSPVAKIANGQYAANFYATLQAAVDAAAAGAQIDILKDFTLTTVTTQPSNKYNVNVNKSVTINGNGYTITSSTGKRPLVLTGEGNDITIKDLTVVNNKADWTLGITNALTCTLDGVTLDGSNYKGTWNQVLTIGSIDEAGKVTLNVTNGSVLKTNDAGTAHYDIIAFHPADINVTDSKLIGWAGIYLKPDAAGSTVKIDGSELVSKGIGGASASNSFATIVTECGNNDIEVIDSKISTTPAEDTYQSLFTLGGTGNNVKLLGSTTYETTNATMGPVTYLPGSLMDNHVYFDDATKAAFQSYFADEDGPQIAEEKEAVSTSAGSQDLYPLNYTPEVFYYWSDGNGGFEGVYTDFADPFENTDQFILGDGEYIRLMQNITLDHDIVNPLESGTINFVLGDFKVTKGNYSLKLKQGQIATTDKSNNFFSAVDEGYVVKETKTDNGYTYTVEEASVKYTDANGKVSYLAKLPNAFNSGTYQLLKDVTHTVRMTTGILATNVTLDLNGHTLTSTATDYAILLARAGTDSKHKTFDLISSAEGGKLVVNSEANAAIQAQTKYNDVTIGENVTIEGGGVAMLSENQTLSVSGAINAGDDFAIATNGSTTKNTTITVNEGAVLSSDITAVYLPGNEGVSTTITGAAITGSDAGIEVRGGDLTVNNSNITSTAEDYSYTANGNGTTTKGAAIAVVQHTTKLPTNVTVNGGTLTGVNQIAVTDANGNGLEGVTVTASNALVETTTLPEGFKWVAAETEGMSTLGPCEYVAQIVDGAKFETLQAAVDAAQQLGGAQTITLLDNISGETVTIKEVANFLLTIDGKKDDSSNYTVNGNIIVDGLRGNSGDKDNGASVTLQNIAFENTTATDAIQPSHYPHHLTIQDCTYTGSEASSNNWFINISDGPLYGATVKNVTVEKSRLLQGNLGLDVVFENIVATNDCKAGFNVKTEGTVLIKDCQVTTAKYAFRDYKEDYVGTINLQGNTFISTSTENDEGAIANRGGKDGTAHINVESGTYVGQIVVLNGRQHVLVISDGKFSAPVGNADYAQFIAEGKTGVNGLYPEEEEAKNGIGTAIATVTTGEDKVNNFASLESAFAAAQDGDTVKPLVNIESLESNIVVGGTYGDTPKVTTAINPVNVTLDLNGKNITSDKTIYLAGGSLNITGEGTIETTGSGVSPVGVRYVKTAANADLDYTSKRTLTIGENVTVKGADYGLNIFGTNEGTVANDIEVNINGKVESTVFVLGNLKNADNNIKINVSGKVTATEDAGIALNGNADVTVAEGAEVTGESGIEVRAGKLTVTGGTITGTAEYSYAPNGSGTTTKGAAVAVAQHNTLLPIDVTIANGTLNGAKTIVVTDAQSNTLDDVTVTAKDELTENTVIPEGFKWKSNGDGTSTLAPMEYVAENQETGKKYESLKDAVAEVGNGETIKMIADVDNAEGMSVASGKNFTVDFDNHTYTLNKPGAGSAGTETSGFQLLQNSTIVFKNGTINIAEDNLTPAVAPAKNIMRIIQNYANLTLDNMTIDGTNQYGGKDYVLSFNNGNSVIKDTKVNAGAGNIAFDACRYSSYPSVGVTVQGNSVITGDIEVDAGSGDPKNGINLNIEGGTISGVLRLTSGAETALNDDAKIEKTVIKKNNDVALDAPEDYKWKDNGNGDGTSTLVPCEYVAQVDNKKYETLEEALAAINEGSTLTLLDNVEMAEDYTATKSFTLTTGEFTFDANDHKFILNHNVSVTTDDQTGMFTAPNDTYIIKEETVSGGYKYTCMTKEEGGIFELLDLAGDNTHPYTFTTTRHAESVTYRRTFTKAWTGMYSDDKATNKRYQCWYVPFDYTIKSEDLEKAEFFKVHLIAAAAEAGEVSYNSKEIYIYIETLKAGDTMYGNRPYVMWVKDDSQLEFVYTQEDVDLLAIDNSSRLDVSTAEDRFDFYGTYKYGRPGKSNCFSLNAEGRYFWMYTSDNRRAYRWYVQATPRDWNTNKNYANMTFFTVEEGGEATGIDSLNITMDNEIEGIYTVDGKKLDHPMKGLNIIRMKDNTVKKVYIK